MRILRKNALMAIGAAAFLLPQIQAGTFTANFNDNATPAGSYLNGQNGGGVIQDGVLKITTTSGSETGGFIIEDLDAGAPVYGFNFTAKVRVDGGGATPADGFSLNFGPDISETTGAAGGEYEDGVGRGIRIAFDIYNNAGEFPPSPSIALRLGNNVIQYVAKNPPTAMQTGPTFADINLSVSAGGAVTLVYNGETIFNNVYFPGYQPITGGRFAIAGRTGGAVENAWFDDISLTTITTPQVGIVTNPSSQTVLNGSTVTITPVLNNVEGAIFQWLKGGTPVSGATEQTLTLNNVSLADSGSKYSLRITGPNNTVTTTEATLTVVDIPLPAATASYDFNSPDAPAGTTLFASDATLAGYISATGGVGDSGVLHLTDAAQSQWGGILIEDLAAGAPVYGITAHFKARVGGGDVPPADGFSFNFASDIADPTNSEYENGVGTGLTVGFDIYDNGGGEAPSVDVRYNGALVSQVKVPISFIETGADFADVLIRLENDGTLDVAYKGVVLFNNLLIPGFSQITGGRVLIGGRTGGLTENMWIDNLDITPQTTAGDLRITTQPVNKYVITGQAVTFSAAVNDATGVTYQWNKGGVPISGANSAEYTFNAAAGDTGSTYTLTATRGGLTATSNPVTLTVLNIAPTVSYDFNNGTDAPAGTLVLRDPADTASAGYISANGGVNDSGALHLTDAVGGQKGGFVVQPLLGGAEIAGLNVAFDVYIGGGSQPPADGFSFNWSDNLGDTIPGGDLEDGAGGDLTIGFDIFDNAGGEGPSVDVRWKGQLVAQTKLTSAEIQTAAAGDPNAIYRKVIIKLTPDGKLDLVYGDRILFTGLQLPNYAPFTNGKYAFYARTGGLQANQWIDNLQIQAIKSVAPLRITTQPKDALFVIGQTPTFTVGVSDPVGATYQWYRGGVPISGATSASYTAPALTAGDSGAVYTVTVTGPGGTATSNPATVVAPITVTNPDVTFSFDGADPEGTTFVGEGTGGGANIGAGGVDGTSALHLTDDIGDAHGAFYIPAFDNGQSVNAFTATFKLLMRSAGPPADGLSFVWGNDITPTGTFGEDGRGNGLIISVDTWDNGGGEAPAIDVAYKGAPVATVKLPIGSIMTGDNFADFAIRLENDGTLDVQYNGQVIFNNLQIPNFTPMADAYFAIGGRTGGASADQWIDDLKIVTTSGASGAKLTIARNADGTVTINWGGVGTLQATSDIASNQWTNLTGATNPVTVTPSERMRFFRVVQ